MVGLEQYRACIGLFQCRGSAEDVEEEKTAVSDIIHSLLSCLKPRQEISEDLAKLLVNVSQCGELDPKHPVVVEAKKVLEFGKHSMHKVKSLSELCKEVLTGNQYQTQARLVLQMCHEGLLDINHPSVIQAKLVIGGTELNPGPMVSYHGPIPAVLHGQDILSGEVYKIEMQKFGTYAKNHLNDDWLPISMIGYCNPDGQYGETITGTGILKWSVDNTDVEGMSKEEISLVAEERRKRLQKMEGNQGFLTFLGPYATIHALKLFHRQVSYTFLTTYSHDDNQPCGFWKARNANDRTKTQYKFEQTTELKICGPASRQVDAVKLYTCTKGCCVIECICKQCSESQEGEEGTTKGCNKHSITMGRLYSRSDHLMTNVTDDAEFPSMSSHELGDTIKDTSRIVMYPSITSNASQN